MSSTAFTAKRHSAKSARENFLSRLQPVPIADPVERRNADMLRIVLVFMGIAQPLSTLPGVISTLSPILDRTAIALSVTSTAIVWLCFLILHRGYFKLAARVFVGSGLLFIAYAYFKWGLQLQRAFQLGQVYPVLVGGVLFSRRALWLCAMVLGVVFVLGAWRDLANIYYDFSLGVSTFELIGSLFSLFVITLIIDRTVTGLRENLAIAVKRGNDLARLRDRMQLEIEEKERSREQMLHAQKMQAVGRLASGIAHDFNHLLTLILGYARRGRDHEDAAELRQALGSVESAAKRAAAVSHKLLNFARGDLTRTEVFDVVDAVDAMRPVFTQLFDPRTKLVYELAEEKLAISFDRAQFELMLLNLAANATQAMPDGGRFSVGVRALSESKQVEIELTDTGHGMTPEVKQRIFEPFFTTRPAGQGTGLGLPAVLNLVTLNHGVLSVESEPGAGATFRIRLPRVTSH